MCAIARYHHAVTVNNIRVNQNKILFLFLPDAEFLLFLHARARLNAIRENANARTADSDRKFVTASSNCFLLPLTRYYLEVYQIMYYCDDALYPVFTTNSRLFSINLNFLGIFWPE